MGKRKDVKTRLSKLSESLKQAGDKLEEARTRIQNEVGPGVDRAMLWSEFLEVVSPVVEASPDHRMNVDEIAGILDNPGRGSPEVKEARTRRDEFVRTHGQSAWTQCLQDGGALQVTSRKGHRTITRITDG